MTIFNKFCRCTIDKKMLPMKLHYLFYALGFGTVGIYFPLIAKSIGISATSLGVIKTILSFVSIAINPIFGYITDKFKEIKFVIIVLNIFLMPTYFSINYIPEIKKEMYSFVNVKLDCDNNSIFATSSQFLVKNPDNKTLECSMDCLPCDRNSSSCRKTFKMTSNSFLNNSQILRVTRITFEDNNTTSSSICFQQINNNCGVNCSLQEDLTTNSFVYYQFWLFVILFTIGDFITDAVISLTDAACLESLQERIGEFGKQALWLSAGGGFSAMVSGYIIEYANVNNKGKTDYSVSFYLMLPLLLIDTIILKFTDMRKEKSSENILKDISRSFLKLHTFFFVTVIFIIGAFSGLQWNYGFWYMEDLGANTILIGVSEAVVCICADIPFMFVSGWIIKRIGRDNSVCLGFISFSVWFLIASFIYNPWWMLLAYLTQGPSYGLFYTSMTSYGKLIAAPGTEATMQTVLGAIFAGLGVGTGTLVGGIGFDKYGGRMVYRFMGYFAICSAVVYKVLTKFIAGESSVIKEENGHPEKTEMEDCDQKK